MNSVVRMGYILVIICFLLMSWAIMTKSSPVPASNSFNGYPLTLGALQEASDSVQYPPCGFNPLCTCSKTVPDLGIVSCRNVPLTKLPIALNSSKLFILRLENNGLRWIEPQLLQNTGLYRLHISDNPLPEMPDDSLMGLERSLWELALQRDRLTSVPNRAIRYLRKLRLLDLTGNDIYELASDSFRGLEESLQTLILAENAISSLPPGAFSELRALEILDMRGNTLQYLDAAALPPRLQHLSLADNLISSMPIAALKPGLRSLDLSRNRLTRVYPEEDDDDTDLDPTLSGKDKQAGNKNKSNKDIVKISMDVLRLEYNFINELPEASFRIFSALNYTFLDGNPINNIYDHAFKDARIRDLSMRECGLSTLPENVFDGLEQSLHYLDLSSNNLSELPAGMLGRFQNLRGLNLRDNRMKINPQLMDRVMAGSVNVQNSNTNTKHSSNRDNKDKQGNAHNLHHLDISGRDMEMFTSLPEMMDSWTGLRELTLGRFQGGKKLSAEDFSELSPDVEELNIVNAGLTGVNAHAFKNARGLRRLDLSENSIKNLDSDAFAEIGHSLDEIRMHRALKMDSVPHTAFAHLTGTKEIDLSANGIKNIPDGSFMHQKYLRRLRLHDNQIGRIPKSTFIPDVHSYLEEVDMSFNLIDHVYVDTFKDLTSLREIRLDDNKVGSLEPKAFTDLPRLRILDLKGNRIEDLNTDTFQNLPELEELDLSFNNLKSLNFAALDQVGTLASLRFNVSHNKLPFLKPSAQNFSSPQGNYHVNVKIMDISHNNITEISGNFFKPIETALTYLIMSHNQLTNATRDAFGNMPHLQWLDLSFNDLKEVDFDAFRHTRRLQVLNMQYNDLTEIPTEAFHGLTEMRVASFAHNYLRALPDGLFFAASNMERLDVSHNQLTRVPVGVFSSGSGRSLCELDLSGNLIAALQPIDVVNRFKSLTFLDLSDNRLTRLDDNTFMGMPHLSYLDLSFNPLDAYGLSSTLAALDSSPRLLELGLAGLNLETLPSLPPLPALRQLDARHNILPALPSDLAANLTGLRLLDVRHNSLNTLGQIGLGGGLILPQLRTLRLANNPLGLITDGCLATATRLGELDIRNLTQLTAIENGALSRMNNLRTLKVGTFNMARDFNIPRIVKHNSALKNLHVELDHREKDLGDKMNGMFPTKLSAVYFSGNTLKSLSTNVLQGIRSSRLHIGIHNTSMETLPKAFFTQLGRTRNLTLDVRNNTFKSIANPNSGERPGEPKAVFLTHLQMSGNKWNCDCELGWVEVWQRKKRQFLCPDGDTYNCQYGAEDDLRDAKCENKQKTSLIDVLKSDLECGWSSGSVTLLASKLLVLVPTLLLLVSSLLN